MVTSLALIPAIGPGIKEFERLLLTISALLLSTIFIVKFLLRPLR
jgi:hypothetical protein